MKRLMLIVALCVALPGCAGWQGKVAPVLSDAAAYIADAQQVLDIARAISNLWFLGHPAPESQARVERALADAALTVDAAIKATKGAEEVTAEQLDAAFADFRRSYAELEAILKDVGVVNAQRLGTGRVVVLPEPLALHGRH